MMDPSRFAENLPEADEEELALMNKIIDKTPIDLDIRAYHDGYKEQSGASEHE